MRLLFLILIFWPAKSCKDKTDVDNGLSKLVYEVSSRGYFRHIEISEEQILVLNDRAADNALSGKISIENWKRMVQMVQSLDLQKLGAIDNSTEESALDRSLIGELTIYIGENSYTSPIFDHNNPPTILNPLITNMMALAETVE